MGPIVSILIPTRNRQNLLLKAVKSVFHQTYHSVEVIVTDNSDTNDAEGMLTSIGDSRIRYEKNAKNIGPILNWRKALEMAKGEYCIVLPDDDYLINPFYIEDAVNILSNSEIQLVVPDCILSYPSKNVIGVSGHSGLINGKDFIREGKHIPHIGNVFRKEMAQRFDAFYSNEILWSDIQLWMKLMSVGDVYCYSKPSILYLFHENNIVLNMSKSELITNSKFIRSSVESFANEKLIAELVVRYLCTIDSISSEVDIEFVSSVVQLNSVQKRMFSILYKVKYQSIKRLIKTISWKVIRKMQSL